MSLQEKQNQGYIYAPIDKINDLYKNMYSGLIYATGEYDPANTSNYITDIFQTENFESGMYVLNKNNTKKEDIEYLMNKINHSMQVLDKIRTKKRILQSNPWNK